MAASLSGVGARIRSVTVYSTDHPGVPAGNRSLCDPVRRYAAQAPHCRLRSGRALAQIGSRRRHRHHSGHHRPVRTGTGTRPASVRCLRLVAEQENLTCATNGRCLRLVQGGDNQFFAARAGVGTLVAMTSRGAPCIGWGRENLGHGFSGRHWNSQSAGLSPRMATPVHAKPFAIVAEPPERASRQLPRQPPGPSMAESPACFFIVP